MIILENGTNDRGIGESRKLQRFLMHIEASSRKSIQQSWRTVGYEIRTRDIKGRGAYQ